MKKEYYRVYLNKSRDCESDITYGYIETRVYGSKDDKYCVDKKQVNIICVKDEFEEDTMIDIISRRKYRKNENSYVPYITYHDAVLIDPSNMGYFINGFKELSEEHIKQYINTLNELERIITRDYATYLTYLEEMDEFSNYCIELRRKNGNK